MLANTPTPAMLEELLGPALFPVWQQLCRTIEERYDMERLWNSGGKNWTYEYKYRRGGKTLCGLYAKSRCLGFLVISGKRSGPKWKPSGRTSPRLSAPSMSRPKPITTGNG